MSVGPFTNNNNLLFGLETGPQNITVAKGQPGTNITTGNNLRWSGANNGTGFQSNGYEEYVDIPTLGRRLVRSMDIYNDYGSSGNCCPSLFGYGDGRTVSGGTVYSYQIIYYCRSGYTHPNYMYHYEYGAGGYITEYGVHTTGQRTHLGNGWYHAWATFTTNASATYINTGLWYYQYGVYDKVSVAAISIAQGSNIRPASQIIGSGVTRSGTQAYLDIKRATSFDVSNISFDSNGQPYFDGSNDYIDLPTSVFPAMNEITIELVNYGINAQNSSVIAGGIGGSQDFNIHLPWGDGNIYWDVGRPFNRVYKAAGSEYIGWHHWVFTKNSSTGVMNIYRDGVLWAQNTGQTSSIISLSGGGLSLGRYHNGSFTGYYHNGKVPVLKIYNKEFSASDAAHNFAVYKTRFSI
jgi:hypothetical protein